MSSECTGFDDQRRAAKKCRRRSAESFDQFPSVAFDDDKARLDNLAIALQNSPDTTAYIIIYGGRTSRTGQADMLGRRSMDYLTTHVESMAAHRHHQWRLSRQQTSSKSGSVRREPSLRSRRQPYNRVTCSLRRNALGPESRADRVASKRDTFAPFGRGALTNR